MKKSKEKKVLSQAFSLAAPLLVLVVATVAWFIRMTSPQVEQMTFAAKQSGAGVSVYPGSIDPAKRQYSADALINSVTWGEKVELKDFQITIENMLPGQCEYYLLSSESPFSVRLDNISMLDSNGNEVGEGTNVPLAQCLSISLLPLDQSAAVGGAPLKEKALVTCPLTRMENEQLSTALLRGQFPTSAISPAASLKAYVLAVFYDPVYQQTQANVETLPGTIHFSLAFSSQE